MRIRVISFNVATSAIRKISYLLEELDFVLVATISPDSSMPSVAALVQEASVRKCICLHIT